MRYWVCTKHALTSELTRWSRWLDASLTRPNISNDKSVAYKDWPGWRNWQTQRTQNPPRATSWGFDPPSRHHFNILKKNRLRRSKPLSPRGFFMPKSAGDTSGDTLLFWFSEESFMPRKRKEVRGVWERDPGSDIWW